MLRETLESINGVEIFPIISFAIFFIFFVGVIIWQYRLSHKYLTDMSNLPLVSNKEETIIAGDKNEI
ncbi:MAG: hypothetical protein ACM3O3_07250 [Syntrophothermus sp.]|nr:cbb3-type cytochrome c oxidase subunit 3 [Ignavibacteriaceae bacterium]